MHWSTLARTLLTKVDARFPVTLTEARALRERLRHAVEPAGADAENEKPRWREELDRELHDEIVDDFLGVRGRR